MPEPASQGPHRRRWDRALSDLHSYLRSKRCLRYGNSRDGLFWHQISAFNGLANFRNSRSKSRFRQAIGERSTGVRALNKSNGSAVRSFVGTSSAGVMCHWFDPIPLQSATSPRTLGGYTSSFCLVRAGTCIQCRGWNMPIEIGKPPPEGFAILPGFSRIPLSRHSCPILLAPGLDPESVLSGRRYAVPGWRCWPFVWCSKGTWRRVLQSACLTPNEAKEAGYVAVVNLRELLAMETDPVTNMLSAFLFEHSNSRQGGKNPLLAEIDRVLSATGRCVHRAKTLPLKPSWRDTWCPPGKRQERS